MDILEKSAAWVSFIFEDSSRMTIYTSCSADYLDRVGAKLRPDSFYDLVHFRYVPFPKDAVQVEVSEEKPVWGQEVLDFASRFI